MVYLLQAYATQIRPIFFQHISLIQNQLQSTFESFSNYASHGAAFPGTLRKMKTQLRCYLFSDESGSREFVIFSRRLMHEVMTDPAWTAHGCTCDIATDLPSDGMAAFAEDKIYARV